MGDKHDVDVRNVVAHKVGAASMGNGPRRSDISGSDARKSGHISCNKRGPLTDGFIMSRRHGAPGQARIRGYS